MHVLQNRFTIYQELVNESTYLFVQVSEGQTGADDHNDHLQRTTPEADELFRPADP